MRTNANSIAHKMSRDFIYTSANRNGLPHVALARAMYLNGYRAINRDRPILPPVEPSIERCALSDLPLGQCACKCCRPDLADIEYGDGVDMGTRAPYADERLGHAPTGAAGSTRHVYRAHSHGFVQDAREAEAEYLAMTEAGRTITGHAV